MLHRVDSPICPPKKQQSSSITLWLLIIVDKAWKTNQAEFFRSTCLPYKILPKTSVRVNQPFILFIHYIWGETVLWGAVFIKQTSDKMQYFTIFQEKLHSFNIQHRSTRWLLAKPFKNFPKSPIQPACTHFWQAQNLQWTLKELRFNIRRNLFCLFFI